MLVDWAEVDGILVRLDDGVSGRAGVGYLISSVLTWAMAIFSNDGTVGAADKPYRLTFEDAESGGLLHDDGVVRGALAFDAFDQNVAAIEELGRVGFLSKKASGWRID